LDVLIVHNAFQSKGGIDTHVRYLSSFLEKFDVKVHHITINMQNYRTPLEAMFRLFSRVHEYTQDHKIDLVHAHFIEPSGIAAYLLRLYEKKPYILTIHGGDVHYLLKRQEVKDVYKAVLVNSCRNIFVS